MFIPGSTDPLALDAAMRTSLAESLDYIHDAVGGRLGLPGGDVHAAIGAIRSRRVVPGVFGRYYKLVLAVQEGAFDAARGLFCDIIDAAAWESRFSVGVYTEGSIGREKLLYGELIDPDPGGVPWLCPPGPADGFEQQVVDALDMIGVADPAFGAELRGLVLQVVGAAPFHGPGAKPFGSVSSFMLWGLLIVNMERYPSAADLVQGLVHEAAHLLLFAHSIAEPMVTNPIEARYVSPLRADPRPMDGVFHATFVAARMHYVNLKLREATRAGFEPVPVAMLDERLSSLRGLYFGGLRTVQEHGRLTATGRQVLEETLDYMKTV